MCAGPAIRARPRYSERVAARYSHHDRAVVDNVPRGRARDRIAGSRAPRSPDGHALMDTGRPDPKDRREDARELPRLRSGSHEGAWTRKRGGAMHESSLACARDHTRAPGPRDGRGACREMPRPRLGMTHTTGARVDRCWWAPGPWTISEWRSVWFSTQRKSPSRRGQRSSAFGGRRARAPSAGLSDRSRTVAQPSQVLKKSCTSPQSWCAGASRYVGR